MTHCQLFMNSERALLLLFIIIIIYYYYYLLLLNIIIYYHYYYEIARELYGFASESGLVSSTEDVFGGFFVEKLRIYVIPTLRMQIPA